MTKWTSLICFSVSICYPELPKTGKLNVSRESFKIIALFKFKKCNGFSIFSICYSHVLNLWSWWRRLYESGAHSSDASKAWKIVWPGDSPSCRRISNSFELDRRSESWETFLLLDGSNQVAGHKKGTQVAPKGSRRGREEKCDNKCFKGSNYGEHIQFRVTKCGWSDRSQQFRDGEYGRSRFKSE